MPGKTIDGITQAIQLMLFYSFALVCIIIVGIIVSITSKTSSGKAIGFFMIFFSIILFLSQLLGS